MKTEDMDIKRRKYMYEEEMEYLWSDMEPDRTMSDFYCKVCDSYMNSELMWESHISGKRHLKNVKKPPGEMPSKVRSLRLYENAKLMDAIKNIHDPLVGLGYMTELQRADPTLNPSYSCHLCQANLTWSVVINHILTTKHRLAYIEAVDPEEYYTLNNIDLPTSSFSKFVEDRARSYESKYGCGTMEVKLEKPKCTPPPPNQDKIDEDIVQVKAGSSYIERTKGVSSLEYIDIGRHHEHSKSQPHKYLPTSYRKKKYTSPDRWRHDRYSPERSASPCSCATSSSTGFIEKLPIRDKMNLMKILSRGIILVSKEEVRKAESIIAFLSKFLLQCQIRQCPEDVQNELAHILAKGKLKTFGQEVCPFLDEIFDKVMSSIIPCSLSCSYRKGSY